MWTSFRKRLVLRGRSVLVGTLGFGWAGRATARLGSRQKSTTQPSRFLPLALGLEPPDLRVDSFAGVIQESN